MKHLLDPTDHEVTLCRFGGPDRKVATVVREVTCTECLEVIRSAPRHLIEAVEHEALLEKEAREAQQRFQAQSNLVLKYKRLVAAGKDL